ncbi:MAG: FAD-binding protein [Candidatus Poseidonia sp.]|nr:FAD-binding protein [Poseidonia sp.]
MEAWDIIVLGDGPAALYAAAEAAKGGASTLLMSASGLGNPGLAALEGLSASIQEANNRSHREDTIRAGAFLCDQDVVAETTANAIKQVDLLERRGLNFRRDQQGLPMVRKAPGHAQPRTVDAGSATTLGLQTVAEEQCMRHGVIRRGDQLPLTLVHTKQSVEGIIALDMVNGRTIGLQCKALIIADEGFEGAFTGGPVGLGMDMAFRAGVALRDMEFIMQHPLAVKDTNLFLPTGLLNDGAKLHEGSGAAIETEGRSPVEIAQAISDAVQPVLDARSMGAAAAWWASTFRLVQQRTGIDMNRQTVPLASVVGHTLGGLPVDGSGRCVVGAWSRWFTGLYAAGDAACTGLHGAAALPGNRLLDALQSGSAAGQAAADWVQGRKFSTAERMESALADAEADLSSMMHADGEGHVTRCGTVLSSLRTALASTTVFNEASMNGLLTKLEAIGHAAESLHLDQSSLIANTNLLEILRTQAAVRMVTASVQSGLARKESRGSFSRDDYPDADEAYLHHFTVNKAGEVDTLALKKGTGGHWVLAPQ